MRKHILAIFIFIIVSISYAAPSVLGGRGLFQVEDAMTEEMGVVSISTYLLAYKATTNIYYSDWIAPNLTYTFASFGEIFFWTGRIVRSGLIFPEVWESHFSSTLHDKVIGAKFSIPYLPVFKVGGKIAYAWPGYDILGVSVIGVKQGLNWGGLASFRFSELYSALPNLILNYGENRNFKLRNYGVGLEISGSGGSIFVEATSTNLKSNGFFEQVLDSLTVTPGFKINTGQYSNLAGGVIIDMKKNPSIPDYTAVMGLTLGSAFLRPSKPKLGMLTGTVTDIKTGDALEAIISFPDRPTLKSTRSNALNGVYKVEKIPGGIVVVEVIAEGYQKQTTPLFIEANKINAYDFKLKSLISYGVIAGNVYDASTNKPLEANISFSDNLIAELKSDPTTGSFKVEKVATGVVTLTVQKEGYFPKSVTVNVEEGKVTNVDLPIASALLKGIFTGKISDKITSKPIAGTVTLIETAIAPLVSDGNTGIFQAEIPVGTYSVSVSADGYLPTSGVITIEKDKVTQSNFELITTELKTIMTGKVSDKKTGNGLKAIISFPEVSIPSITTDSLTGVYRAEIAVGSYLVEVKSEGYLTQTSMVIAEQGKALEKNFELVKKGMVITLKGVYFESGKATLKPESYSVLQEAAKVLTDNPKIKVEIQGHTDNIGSATLNQTLSEKRAYAVMEYLVKTLGIAPARLTAKGYGFTKPIAANETSEGRALNRRVDFVILEQEE